ncbi:MAG: hypothetical protein RL699_942 [Bacteroidota bacterium]|jgi:hypothetical protein
MKKVFYLCIVLLSISVSAQVSRIQSATGNTGADAAANFSVTMAAAPINGNTLIAIISTRGTTASRVSGIIQTGATWTKAVEGTNASGSTTEIWYAPNISNAGTTVSIAQASLLSAAVIAEYSGLLTVNPLDDTSSNIGSGNTISYANGLTTSQANELLIAGVGITNSSFDLSTQAAYTGIANDASTNPTATNNSKVFAYDRIVTATGGFGFSAGQLSAGQPISNSTNSPWTSALAAFKIVTNTAGVASSSPTLCINTPLTNITHTTTLATGIVNDGVSGANNLPAGVSATWSNNTITISGTPTASGTYNYSIPLSGGVGTVNATGTIRVDENAVYLASAAPTNAQTVCINTAIGTIQYQFNGLSYMTNVTLANFPTGITPSYNNTTKAVNLTGTPTQAGTFNYTVTSTGGACTVSATGTLTVSATSLGGTIAGSASYCSTTNSTTLTLSGHRGAITRWESSPVSNFTSGSITQIANTTTTLTITDLTATTYYRAVITNSPCVAVNSAVATVGVSTTVPATPGAISGPTAPCTGYPNQYYSIAAVPGAITYNWTVPTGWSITNGAGTANITVTVGSNGQNGNISVSAQNGCGTSDTRTLAVITGGRSAGPASSAPTLCVNNVLTNITHTTSNVTQIQHAGNTTGFNNLPPGVTSTYNNNTITISGTPTVPGTYNYSIALQGGTCNNSAVATGTIIVNDIPGVYLGSAVGSNNQTVCVNQGIGTIYYQFYLTTPNSPQSSTAGITGFTVSGLPSGISGTYNTHPSSLSVYITGSTNQTGIFPYTITSVGGACSAISASGTITISPPTVAGAVTGSATVCAGTNSTTLTLSGHTGSVIKWQSAQQGTFQGLVDINNTTTTLTATNVSTSTFYRAVVGSGSCGQGNSDPANITVTSGSVRNWIGGNGNWSNAANWCGGLPSSTDAITITEGTPRLDVNFTVAGTLTISGTGGLVVNPLKKLSISGTANFGGKSVVLQSDATGDAILGQITGTLSNASNVTVERYIPQGKRASRFITPGVTTTTFIAGNWQLATHITGSTTGAGGFDVTASGNPSLFTYNNTAASGTGWTPISNTDATNLKAAEGYRLLIRGDRTPTLITNASEATMNTAITLRATGQVKTGQVVFNSSSSPAINSTTNSTTNGFSLVGNPYVSPVDWHTVTKSGISDSYYAWDANMGTTAQRGRYVTYSASTGFNNLGNSGSSQIGRYIQPGQAFFVRNSTLGTPGTLTFNETDKADTFANVFRAQEVLPAKLGMLVYEPNELALGSTPIDGAIALFGENYTNAIDGGDIEKLESAGENLAWLSSTKKLTMTTLASVADNDELFVKTLRFSANKSYTFQFEPLHFDTSISAFLVDHFLNTQAQIDLTQNNTITINTTSDVLSYGEDRFKIVFQVSLLSNPDFESSIRLYPNPSAFSSFYLNLSHWNDTTKVILNNALGQEIPLTLEFTNGLTRQFKSIHPLPIGMYYIAIAQDGERVTKKWIVQ